MGYSRTELGKYVNHSEKPNLRLEQKQNSFYYIAKELIHKDEEFTINYDLFPWEGIRGFS
ncbi:MAG: SET domain-containing protein [Nanoarchaeota archaeon]